MIGNPGIDQEVQAKMDAYRGNPNALAQKYSQNQQLIDLLALQKLKSEKEAAAREMQMKMGGQQMPTIADAREQEVLDLTKQEVAEQATGAMQQQQRQKQQAAKQLVEQTAQGGIQAPMMSGVAGLPAPNMAPKAMATGGIVAFQAGGEPPAPADEPPVYSDEELRQRILRGEVPPPAAAAPQGGGSMGSLARQGIMRLLGGEDPQRIYDRRTREATAAAGYTPEERAIIQRQIADRAAMDAAKFDPERRRSEGLTRWLLGAGGRTGIGSVLGGAGAAALNYGTEMDAQERQALIDRQKQEQGLVDVGPAARMAGMKIGSEAEKMAIQGLHYGVDAAARLEQIAAQAAARGNPEEAKRLAGAARQINSDPFLRQGSALLNKLVQENRTDDPIYNQTLRDMESRQNQIYKAWKLDTPEIPMPSQSVPSATPPTRSWGEAIQGFLGLTPTPSAAPRAVPFSALPK